jgi:hypothetical protein
MATRRVGFIETASPVAEAAVAVDAEKRLPHDTSAVHGGMHRRAGSGEGRRRHRDWHRVSRVSRVSSSVLRVL